MAILNKINLVLALILLPLQSAFAMPFVEAIVLATKQCYDQGNKTESVPLAKCISKKLQYLPNPENYIVNIEGTSPHKLTMYLYNPKGFKIICSLTAEKTIEIKQCHSVPAKPLNQEQQLSISPQ
ncbi:hypothetical protein ACNVED_09330 [Legionella sp. D16C41]|uniref:hypothetical protein n=1 Tax=Legionella sp. D16C41 TaxID=3402688 RepID=UPI003AF77699